MRRLERTQGGTIPISELAAELSVLVPQLFEAEAELYRQKDFEPEGTFEECLGKPCSPEEISKLEEFLGRPIPPSYRAFLSLYGYWKGFRAIDLLGPDDHRDQRIRDIVKWKSTMFDEFEPVNPIKQGAIPLAIGEGRPMVLLEPPVRANGEMDVVEYHLTEEVERAPDLVAFLRAALEKRRSA